MTLRNLSTGGKSEHKDWKTLGREGVNTVEHEESEAMVTSIGRDEVQLMDMESYETYEIEKPGVELTEGDVYRVVSVKGKRYIRGRKEEEK